MMMAGSLKPHRRGLVVGKFSPLHRGHELVIQQAIEQCDEVMVLGYSQPDFPGCDRAARTRWVAARFPSVRSVQVDDETVRLLCLQQGLAFRAIPDNRAPDAEQQDWLVWLLGEVLHWQPDAMLASEHYLGPTTERMAHAWTQPVTPVMVDIERQHHPISATRIRQDVHAHREWLHPEVYRSFVPRVVILGGESTGKTTLAAALAEAWQTCWVPEYGRECWELRGGQLTLEDLIDIGTEQVAREEAMHRQAHRVLFCDTSPLTTLGYAGWMFEAQPPSLVQQAQRPYDLAVLCEPDFGFVQDGTRQNEDFRDRQQAWYEQQLQDGATPWIRASGSLPERIDQVRLALAPQAVWSRSVLQNQPNGAS